MAGPASSSAGGTLVVLPEPGSATTTTARRTAELRPNPVDRGVDRQRFEHLSRERGWRRCATPNVGAARSSGASGDANRAGHASAAQAAVAVGILREVLLMVVLGVIELWRRQDFGRDRAIARSR